MKPPRARLTRREAALVAAALLLPIPLFAQSGLSVPLPDSVSRSLGSLVTVEASDERSGTEATGNASENGRDTERSGHGTVRIKRGSRTSPTFLLPDGVPAVSDVTGVASDQPAGDSGSGGGNTPAGGEPGGDGGNAGSPGSPDSGGSGSGGSGSAGAGPAGTASSGGSGAKADPGIRVGAAGQGSSGGATVSTGDSGIDVSGGNGGAPGEDEGSVTVEITDTDGSSTGIGVTVPGTRSAAPTLPTIP
jgi:hypothetical protein